jgi:hypothetical protein
MGEARECMGLTGDCGLRPSPAPVVHVSNDGLPAGADIGVDMVDLDNLLPRGS